MISEAKRLTPMDRLILSSLKRKFRYFKSKRKLTSDGSFYYDDQRLAYEESASESTIRRSKRRLRDHGLIKFETGIFKGRATKYWVLEKALKMLPFRVQERLSNLSIKDSNLPLKGCQNDTPNIVSNEEINNKHFSLPLSYLEEVFNQENKDKVSTKDILLLQGYTEHQIEEAFWRIEKKGGFIGKSG